MKKAFILILPLILCGCGSLSGLLDFGNGGDDDVAVVEAAPAPAPLTPAAPANAAFCQGVAMNDATGHAFDEATQKQVAQQSFTQCLALYHP